MMKAGFQLDLKKTLLYVILLAAVYVVLFIVVVPSDFAVTLAINTWAATTPPAVQAFARFYTTYAYYIFGAGIIVLVLASFDSEKVKPYRMFLLGYATGFAAGLGISSLMKAIVAAPRPFQEYPGQFQLLGLTPPKGASFPSNHAVAGFAMAAPPMWKFKKWFVWVPLAAYAVTLALSRPFFGVHFVTDILAGSLIGIAAGMAFTLLFESMATQGKLTEDNQRKYLFVMLGVTVLIIVLNILFG
ncbi:MAG TPA: phosphatase PAP2 family protein [Candidatus Lokiarchaeia archaeon]|nr:phosphatase PAP2 family protein [Candidatus Lokiarchaeia archaeon]